MKILCVDDEPLALEMLTEAIEEAQPDADIKPFNKQSELLEEARQNGCDIAFLDIHMRGMNGVELAKKLKEINPKMNIIFVTGYDEYTGDAMRLRASGYVMKPVDANTRAAAALFEQAGVPTAFGLNPGGHFNDPEGRTARGIAWLLEQG